MALAVGGLLAAGCASGGEEAAAAPEPAAQPAAEPAPAAASDPASEPGAAAAPEAAAEPEPVAVAGVFTEGQADRGRTAFDETCSECHTTSEFRGRSFQRNWGRRTVYALFRTIRSTMPDDNPGGLEESVYLDVVSYILSINGHEAGGAELTAESPMRDVRIAPPEPGEAAQRFESAGSAAAAGPAAAAPGLRAPAQ